MLTKKIATLAVALTLAVSVAACSKKHVVTGTLDGVVPRSVVTEKVTLPSLDRRVTAIEQRNGRIDARAVARRNAAVPR